MDIPPISMLAIAEAAVITISMLVGVAEAAMEAIDIEAMSIDIEAIAIDIEAMELTISIPDMLSILVLNYEWA